jgi:hypothetical protein
MAVAKQADKAMAAYQRGQKGAIEQRSGIQLSQPEEFGVEIVSC